MLKYIFTALLIIKLISNSLAQIMPIGLQDSIKMCHGNGMTLNSLKNELNTFCRDSLQLDSIEYIHCVRSKFIFDEEIIRPLYENWVPHKYGVIFMEIYADSNHLSSYNLVITVDSLFDVKDVLLMPYLYNIESGKFTKAVVLSMYTDSLMLQLKDKDHDSLGFPLYSKALKKDSITIDHETLHFNLSTDLCRIYLRSQNSDK